MATKIELDETLINEAIQRGGHRTKKAAVEEALKEYVQRRKQLELIHLFGTIDYDPAYNHKAQRRKK